MGLRCLNGLLCAFGAVPLGIPALLGFPASDVVVVPSVSDISFLSVGAGLRSFTVLLRVLVEGPIMVPALLGIPVSIVVVVSSVSDKSMET